MSNTIKFSLRSAPYNPSNHHLLEKGGRFPEEIFFDPDEVIPPDELEEEVYHDRLLRSENILDKSISWRDPRRSVDFKRQKISDRIEEKLSENPFQLPGIDVYREAKKEMVITHQRALIKQNIRRQRGERSLANTTWITLENSWDWDENDYWSPDEGDPYCIICGYNVSSTCRCSDSY